MNCKTEHSGYINYEDLKGLMDDLEKSDWFKANKKACSKKLRGSLRKTLKTTLKDYIEGKILNKFLYRHSF